MSATFPLNRISANEVNTNVTLGQNNDDLWKIARKVALKSTSGCKNIGSALTLNKILGIAKDISYILAIHYDHVMEQVVKSSYKKLLLCEHVNGKQRIAACLLSAATFVLGPCQIY